MTGAAQELKGRQALGVGLDEKAIEAVQPVAVQPCELNGKPVVVQAAVRSQLPSVVRDRDGQIARLNFTLQPGTTRPELTRGELPGNPATPGDQFLRIRIQVDEEGKLRNSTVLESTDEDWG